MSDRIELRGLRLMGVHGVNDFEKVRPQPFEVDVDLHVDVRDAGASDDLEHSVSYSAAADRVARVVTEERWELLERLATRIAEELLVFSRVERVEVVVRKLRPPLVWDVATAGVRIVRPVPDR